MEQDVFTTMDYREVLGREDVDSVIITTSDFWCDKITNDALKAGKSVYLEKPMVQHIVEEHLIIQVVEETCDLLQVGSQSTSSVLNANTKEFITEGVIGNLNFLECYWDRQPLMESWNYPISPSEGPDNIDWDFYLKDLPDQPYVGEKLFGLRKCRDFGTGVAGDIFAQDFSDLHFITESLEPDRIYGTGGIRYWHDGSIVPDVMLAFFDFPNTENHQTFNLSLRVNFVYGSGGGYSTRFVGSDGDLSFAKGGLTLSHSPMESVSEMIPDNFSEDVQQEYKQYHAEKYLTTPYLLFDRRMK